MVFAFIKFFIFGEPPPADVRASNLASARRQRTLRHKAASSSSSSSSPVNPGTASLLHRKTSRPILRGTPAAPLTAPAILAKTYYNVRNHQPESLDWFNVLVAQTLAQFRADAQHDDAILASLNDVLNGPARPDWMGEIRVTEVALGEEFPIFSNCRVTGGEEGGAGGEGRLQARMDVDLSDVITLGVETKLVLNYPRPTVAVLPVALAVSVVRFSGTVSLLSFPPPPPPPPAFKLHHADPLNPLHSSR